MPSEREEVWVDEMDGPERHARAKKKRAEQLKRWERRESTSSHDDTKRRRKNEKSLKFIPNVIILEAAARNDLAEVARLLESGVSPDLANEDGLTALHQSCIDGCDDMVKYLIEHNANVNACDKESWTPLHAATACNHMTIIRYLCENGGNILALNLDGNFPVDLIESNEEAEKYLDQQLSKLGYDDEAIEELRQNQGKQLLDDLKNFVKNGDDLDIQDDNGATAFHVAAAQGWTNIVNFLLENEADFEIRDDDGWQPIHAAATWGHDDVLEILVASGADLDSKTNNAETPLDLTEEDEMIELIEELKTKEVTYPRRGKGVRRRRSNTNTSIKRSSIHEKNELSHADTKAEGAALFIQLQNTENSGTNSPDEPTVSHESHPSEQASNSSRDESSSSSGYHSEGSTKSEEKTELSQSGKTTTDKTTKEKDVRNSGNYNDTDQKEHVVQPDKKEVTVTEEKSSTTSGKTTISTNNIKQSPVPKPPRLIKEAKPYINLEIGPSETATSTPVKRPQSDAKENAGGSENVEASATKNSANKTELNKTPEPRARVHGGQTTSSERRATPLLPKLAPSDKRRAPEPPDAPKNDDIKQLPASAPRHDSASGKKIDHEVPTVLAKRAAPSSSPPPPQRNTAVKKTPSEEQEPPLAKKSGTRSFTFPRTRKTCCSLM